MSLYQDDVEMSARDLVVAMLTISDNVATDALLDLVGLDRVNAVTSRLGLTGTWVASDLRSMIEPLLAGDLAGLEPGRGSRTTAGDMARLLELVWTDRAGPAAACERVRGHLRRQLTKHRLASGFDPEVVVSAKSGGLWGVVRNEVGVVAYPDDETYAVAVFTRSDPEADGRPIDACIGTAARLAVEALRDGEP
jgi:beta-lactamase class A